MHIGIFYRDFNQEGGFPRELRRYVHELIEIGERVTVYTLEGMQSTNIRNLRVNTFKPDHSLNPFRLPLGLKNHIMNDSSSLDVLIIVGCFIPINISVASVAATLHIPYIMSPSGDLAPNVIKRSPLKKVMYIELLLKKVLRKAMAIHCYSPLEVDWVRKYTDKKHIITTFGAFLEDVPDELDVDWLRNKYKIKRETFVLLYFGRLDIEGKGIDELINAMKILSKTKVEATLLIIGPDQNENRERLTNIIKTSLLTSKIIIGDPVYGDEKFNVLGSADLLVLPSRYDAVPRVVREALSVSCPVVVSEETQTGHLIEKYDAGRVCDVCAISIADNIRFLIEDDGRLKRYRENAKTAADEGFSWRKQAELLKNGVEKVLQKNLCA